MAALPDNPEARATEASGTPLTVQEVIFGPNNYDTTQGMAHALRLAEAARQLKGVTKDINKCLRALEKYSKPIPGVPPQLPTNWTEASIWSKISGKADVFGATQAKNAKIWKDKADRPDYGKTLKKEYVKVAKAKKLALKPLPEHTPELTKAAIKKLTPKAQQNGATPKKAQQKGATPKKAQPKGATPKDANGNGTQNKTNGRSAHTRAKRTQPSGGIPAHIRAKRGNPGGGTPAQTRASRTSNGKGTFAKANQH